MKKWIFLIPIFLLSSCGAQFGNVTVSNFLKMPQGATCPGTCEEGTLCYDTDATTGQRLYACESGSWVQQGGSGGGDSITVDGVAVVDPDFNDGGHINFTDTSNVITGHIKGTVINDTLIAFGTAGNQVGLNDLMGATDDTVTVGDGSVWVSKALANGFLKYNTTTNTFSAAPITKYVVLFDKNTNHSLSFGAFDWKAELPIGGDIGGLDITDFFCQVTGAVGTTNTLEVRLRSCPAVATGRICKPGTGDFDVTSTDLTVDSGQDDSGTAGTPYAIPASADTVTQGQMLIFFVDAVHDLLGQGLVCELEFQ